LELQEWHSLACDVVSDGEITPRVMSARVQQLERAHLVLKSDLSEALSQLRSAEDARNKMERELRAEKERFVSLQTNHAAQTSRMQKMDRKLQLITKVRIVIYCTSVDCAVDRYRPIRRVVLHFVNNQLQALVM
jgi:predicted RNase H-like nuclease (RuvC/YqgF family)